ncbi:MAG: hypothetical protein FWD05_06585 [Oscillospiraceae bacterium]|nr:hypothetical protein [Oscillospiraceae bacterium]
MNQHHQSVVNQVQSLLLSDENKPEWVNRYSGYADAIIANLDSIKGNRRRLREWAPLKFYLNITNAKKAKRTVRFDVRYLGQTVAELISNTDGVTLSTKATKDYESTNLRDFDCDIKLRNAPWVGKEAAAFRAFFKNRNPMRNNTETNKSNEEHRVESLLLSEFSKSEEKTLPNIKPVMIEGLRFPMPTPIGASKFGKTKYAKQGSGGIDILARVGTGGRATYLCVIELKDENKPSEPASHAIEQALKYAIFIRELLRSNAGADWWKLFGLGGSIPAKLTIHAVCAMPHIENVDTSFAGEIVQVGDDEIQLDYIYFTEQGNEIIDIKTSLSYGKQAEVSV